MRIKYIDQLQEIINSTHNTFISCVATDFLNSAIDECKFREVNPVAWGDDDEVDEEVDMQTAQISAEMAGFRMEDQEEVEEEIKRRLEEAEIEAEAGAEELFESQADNWGYGAASGSIPPIIGEYKCSLIYKEHCSGIHSVIDNAVKEGLITLEKIPVLSWHESINEPYGFEEVVQTAWEIVFMSEIQAIIN